MYFEYTQQKKTQIVLLINVDNIIMTYKFTFLEINKGLKFQYKYIYIRCQTIVYYIIRIAPSIGFQRIYTTFINKL